MSRNGSASDKNYNTDESLPPTLGIIKKRILIIATEQKKVEPDFKLIINDDEGNTTVIPLLRDELTIGRKDGNTIRLNEQNISRYHAKLIKFNSTYNIEDLNSYNGIKVNGVKIKGTHQITPGDLITIGDFQLTLQMDLSKTTEIPIPVPVEEKKAPDYARLVMLCLPEPGREFRLIDEELTIGRSDENKIIVNHPSVSRQHAQIKIKDGKYIIKDLESANGVRVNGEDFTEHELNTGDVVELGVIKFRYVQPGESYVFEADQTIQIESAIVDGMVKTKRNLIPYIVGVTIIVIGVVIYLVVSSDDKNEQNNNINNVQIPLDNDYSIDDLMILSKNAMQEENWDKAVIFLSKILTKSPENIEAKQLLTLANTELEAFPIFEKIQKVNQRNDLETIYNLCKRISEKSRYHSRPPCDNISTNYKNFIFNKIRESIIAYRIDDAQRYISTIKSFSDLTKMDLRKIRDYNEEIIKAESKKTQIAVNIENNKVNQINKNIENKEVKIENKQKEIQIAKNNETQGERLTEESAMEQARKCLAPNNDQLCCIRVLSKAPQSKRVLNLLASCYNRAGQTENYCNTIKRAAKLYPNEASFAQALQYTCGGR